MATSVPLLTPTVATTNEVDEQRHAQSFPEEKHHTYAPSMDKINISESNILSSLFDGIPMAQAQTSIVDECNDQRTPIECVNVTRSNFGFGHAVLLKTGFREPNETRVILKHRPLGIRIKPVNVHGFGAMVSKITNQDVYALGVRENMIITGLNNKDLLGCTFDQITNVIKSAHPPITLRLKHIQANANHRAHSYTARNKRCRSISAPSVFHFHGAHAMYQYGPYRNEQSTAQHLTAATVAGDADHVQNTGTKSKNNGTHWSARHRRRRSHKQHNSNRKIAAPTPLMLASFAADHMPSTTILSSSSDEDDDDYDEQEHQQGDIGCGADASKYGPVLDVKQDSDADDDEDDDDDVDEDDDVDDDDDEDDGGRSCVSWNNIRLGASVIQHGGILDLTEETAFKLAYGMLIRQGLNVYEIRAAMRLIREQPEQVPSLESFKHLSVGQQRRTPCGASTPTIMPQEWLKEYNFNDVSQAGDDDSDSCSQSTALHRKNSSNATDPNRTVDDDDDDDDDEDATLSNPRRGRTPSISINSGPHNIGSLERERNRPSATLRIEVNENRNLNRECATQLLHQARAHSQPIKGYIDFFDDNETSQSQSPSHSMSHIQRAFDMIGLKSPVEQQASIATSSDCDDEEEDDDDADDDDDDDDDDVAKQAHSELGDAEVHGHEHEHEHEAIGVSSYISTESAEMLDDHECLPQFMIKHSSLPNAAMNGKASRGINILQHLRNVARKPRSTAALTAAVDAAVSRSYEQDLPLSPTAIENEHLSKLSKFKKSMVRGLRVGTNTPAVQSLFRKLTSPKSNGATSNDTNHGSQNTLTSSSWNDVRINSCVE